MRSIRQLIPTGSSRPLVCCLWLLVLAAACAAPASSPPPAGTAPGSTGLDAPMGAATSIPPLRHVTVAYPAPVVTMSGFDIAIHEGYARGGGPGRGDGADERDAQRPGHHRRAGRFRHVRGGAVSGARARRADQERVRPDRQ